MKPLRPAGDKTKNISEGHLRIHRYKLYDLKTLNTLQDVGPEGLNFVRIVDLAMKFNRSMKLFLFAVVMMFFFVFFF